MHGVRLLFLGLMLGIAAGTAVAAPIPALTHRVTDATGTLSSGQADQIEALLKDFEGRKGTQVAVLIVPTTAPDTIEEYGIRVADAWKLGRKGVDDGAILLVARDDRALRIEVGRGLEGVLPDVIAKRIIEETIVPEFKQGNMAGGIEAGVRRVLKVIDGEPLPPPSRTPSARHAQNLGGWIPVLFFAIPIGGGLLRMVLGRLGGGLVGATLAAAVAWYLGAPLLVTAFVACFVLLFIVANNGSRHGASHSGWGSSSGGWSSGSSGGGFSGGGGSFGGGGASGRW